MKLARRGRQLLLARTGCRLRQRGRRLLQAGRLLGEGSTSGSAFLAPFCTKNCPFTKTGSGQTQVRKQVEKKEACVAGEGRLGAPRPGYYPRRRAGRRRRQHDVVG